MFNAINKKKIMILWILSITIFLVGAIVAQFKPFSEKGSGILMWFSFNSALLALTITAVKNRKKFKIIFYIGLMLYFTYDVVLRFI